ncbi:MAG: HAMP domain-containing protein [Chloroflexota bacterium]
MAFGRLKVATQLSLLVGATALVSILLLGALLIVETRRVVESEIEDRSTALLLSTGELLATPLAYGDHSSVNRLLETIVQENALDEVYAFSVTGHMIAAHAADTGPGGSPKLEHTLQPEQINEVLQSGAPVIRAHDLDIDIAVPITLGGHPIGVVLGVASSEDAMAAIVAAAPRIGTAALIVALVAALFAVGIGRYMAAPLKTLAAAATAVGEGRLEAPTGIRRGGEVGALAAAFTRMVEDLRVARAEVAEQQHTLERRVAERTAELERALEELSATAAERERLINTVRELSSPVLPVMEGVLVMPLIGVIDSERAAIIIAALLGGVQNHQARVVILDVTGVPIVDTQVARALIQAAEAVRLLGAQTVLVGLRPELAQTIVGLGLDLSGLITRADLQSGVEYARSKV